ncbi:MAG TPA: hypothetical protein ENF78_05780 [Candidatus Bathyarchaeota archaeon]|nr:hypothetical protein [Candidatus Bathyarchaeota archaeon]
MPFIMDPKWIAVAVFVGVYLLIVLGLRELTVASLAGVTLLLLLGVLSWEETWHYVDFDIMALLIGVMMVARMLSHVGFFRWLGIHMANLVRCDPTKMMVFFIVVSALLTSFAGATVVVALMMSMVAIEIMDVLELDPRPLVLSLIFTVNIAGMSTSVSSLPTILIASALRISFWDFLSHMWLPTIVSVGALLGSLFLFFRHSFLSARPKFRRIPIDPSEVIADKKLFVLYASLFVAMIIGFIIGPYFGLMPGAVALIVASIMLIVGGKRVGPVVREVDWETVLSITCLLMLVGALDKWGVITDLAAIMAPALMGNKLVGATAVLWSSAIISAFIDNVPYTITMRSTLIEVCGLRPGPLWWALAAGTCLGGNGTVIASYANLVVASAASEKGYKISPKAFAKLGLPLVLITTAISNLAILASVLLWS